MIQKIHYNRYIGELWMWMIFFEWIITFNCFSRFSSVS